jgi:hypothetical protein
MFSLSGLGYSPILVLLGTYVLTSWHKGGRSHGGNKPMVSGRCVVIPFTRDLMSPSQTKKVERGILSRQPGRKGKERQGKKWVTTIIWERWKEQLGSWHEIAQSVWNGSTMFRTMPGQPRDGKYVFICLSDVPSSLSIPRSPVPKREKRREREEYRGQLALTAIAIIR